MIFSDDQKGKPSCENKLYLYIYIYEYIIRSICEKSMFQIKEDMARTILRIIRINQIYMEIVKQITVWIELGLLTNPNPEIANVPLKDLQFTPTNYAIM